MVNYNTGYRLWSLRKHIEGLWILGTFCFVELLGESGEEKQIQKSQQIQSCTV